MKMTTVLGNVTVTGWARTEESRLSSTKEIDSVKDMKVSSNLSYQGMVNFQGKEVKIGLALCLEISACSALGNGVSINTTYKWTHPGYALIYGPRKVFGLEDSGYSETSRRASARVWRGRFADLEPPRDYQLSVGVEMRWGWPDPQTQVRKFQEKSELEKSKSDEGGQEAESQFFRSRATWKELAQCWECSGMRETWSTNPCDYFPEKVKISVGVLGFEQSKSHI